MNKKKGAPLIICGQKGEVVLSVAGSCPDWPQHSTPGKIQKFMQLHAIGTDMDLKRGI